MTRTWEDNAREFGALSKQGVDVRLAVLVAASVEKTKAGRPAANRDERNDSRKVSASAFADAAGTSTPRVLRHLDAWNRAAEQGLCQSSADLSPEDANDPDLMVPDETDFKAVFTVPDNAGGRTMGNVATAVDTIAKRGAEAVVAALTPQMKAELVAQIIEQSEETMRAEIATAALGRVPEPVQDRIVATTEKAKRTEEWAKRREQAEGRERESRKARPDLRYIAVDDALEDAYKKVRFALDEAQGVEFTNDQRQDIAATIRKTTAALHMLDALITGTTSVDWDAELSKLGSN